MIPFGSFLALAAFALADAPPAPAVALLAALESGDLSGTRATLADDATIADSRGGRGVESSIEALSDYARGCARTDLTWEYDSAEPERAAVTVTWSCPSRAPSQAFVWTVGTRVVWVQFGLPAPDLSP